ncbi:hypothetical protein LTR78_003222 [Recurvomyces mirabilis]|uniref:SRR1-like domain-containing protein n=1 Tax=Recurvomyces mirabilis TaxID=574656 RepID=A0AAE0WSC4_9PEZI|nr:hypothetical protein LTR78_003222 [Recurvomyces mirabilis]KAK5156960.1 hypothetical protein LTS14_004477 [Recurvomyces mirabilis]
MSLFNASTNPHPSMAFRDILHSPGARVDLMDKHIIDLIDSHSMPHGVEEALGDGWCKIGRGKGRTPAYRRGLNPPLMDLTLDQLRADFATKSKAWRQSSCRKETLAIIDKQVPEGGWAITEAICLATGSFSRDNWASRQRSVTQFAAFVDIVQHLQDQQQHQVIILAQDPVYTALDIDFLRDKSIRTLFAEKRTKDDPVGGSIGEADDHMSSSCFVFEPCMDMTSHGALTLLSPEPALYIGSCFERAEDDSKKTDEEIMHAERSMSLDQLVPDFWETHYKGITNKLKAVLAKRKRYVLPVFEEEPNIFASMSVSWMEASDENPS